MMQEAWLPPELWLHIFRQLAVADLSSARLVCTAWWRLLDSAPHLWIGVRVNKRKLQLSGRLPAALLAGPQLRHAVLDLSRAWLGPAQWTALLTQLTLCPPIHSLSVAEADMAEVEPALLTAALSNARTVVAASLHNLDWDPVFRGLAASPTLQSIDLSENFLPLVPVPLFVATLARLQQVELNDSLVTGEQLRGLVEAVATSGTRLAANIVCENIHHTPLHLVTAFSRLYKTYFYLEDYSEVTEQAWSSVLRASRSAGSILEELSIDGLAVRMEGVEPELLASSLSSLSCLKLSGVQLTPSQWTALLNRLRPGQTKQMTELTLRMVNLTCVPVSVLAPALAARPRLALEFAALSDDQWVALLVECAAAKPALLRIVQCGLPAELPASLLAGAVAACQAVDLSASALQPRHTEAVLEGIPGSRTTDATLQGLDLSGVPGATLARAATHLTRLNLRKTRLDTPQVTALLAANLANRSRLRCLDLSGVNLSPVPADLLALSVSRLREADLCLTWLTRDQVAGLATQITRYTRLEHLRLQSASVSLLSPDMKRNIDKNMKLVVY